MGVQAVREGRIIGSFPASQTLDPDLSIYHRDQAHCLISHMCLMHDHTVSHGIGIKTGMRTVYRLYSLCLAVFVSIDPKSRIRLTGTELHQELRLVIPVSYTHLTLPTIA